MTEFYTNVFHLSNHIFIRGFDKAGNRVQRKVPYEPTLFIKNQSDSGYKNIFGQSVAPKTFTSIREANDFIRAYENVDGMDIYGYSKWSYAYMYENYKAGIPDTSKINIVSLDIEVQSDDGFPQPSEAVKEITAIAMRRRNMKIVLGCGEFQTDDKNVYYCKCDNERELLTQFLKIWEKLDVDVLTGWNTEFFDIPYLVNRIRGVLGDDAVKRLSPWGLVHDYSVKFGSKDEVSYDIKGIACLDYVAVYKKFRLKPRESYRLEPIASSQLGEKNID